MNLLGIKIVVVVGLALATAFFGLLPHVVKVFLGKRRKNKTEDDETRHLDQCFNSKLIISLLLCFGGGVLLSTCCIHMLPEIRDTFEKLGQMGQVWLPDLPWAEICLCSGFFLIYLVEEVVHMVVHARNHHDQEYVDLHEAIGSRKCSVVSNVMPKEEAENCGDNGVSCVTKINMDFGSKDHLVINSDATPSIQITEAKKKQLSTNIRHGHSHSLSPPSSSSSSSGVVDSPDMSMSSLRHLMTVLALSLHAIFEGLAVGLQQKPKEVWYLFGAICSHKLVLAFCIGTELTSTATRTRLLVASVLVFAIVSPIGICIGIAVTDAHSAEGTIVTVLQGIAAGTLLYVVFFEVLQRERTRFESYGLLQLTSIFIGFILMTILSEALDDDVDDDDTDSVTSRSTQLFNISSESTTFVINSTT